MGIEAAPDDLTESDSQIFLYAIIDKIYNKSGQTQQIGNLDTLFNTNVCILKKRGKYRERSSPGENMTQEEKSEAPPVKGDQITNVIGEVGRWQIEKILIVFFAAAPGK